MLNGAEEFAHMLRERDNPPQYSPVFGKIEELPDIKIRRGNKVQISQKKIKSLINLLERNATGDYIYLGKHVAMLPYNDNNNYLVLGVVYNV